jgi:ABC-type multidrug transport system ATPase subunit
MFRRTPHPSPLVELVTVEPRAVAQAFGLSKVYGSGQATVTALDDVTVDFARGQLTASMGPSGSGKAVST